METIAIIALSAGLAFISVDQILLIMTIKKLWRQLQQQQRQSVPKRK